MARKRNVDKKTTGDQKHLETKSKGKKKKGKENTKEPSKTTSKSSLAFSLLFLTLAISGGLYIYYFVDVDDVLVKVQKQIDLYNTKDKAETGHTNPIERETNTKNSELYHKHDQVSSETKKVVITEPPSSVSLVKETTENTIQQPDMSTISETTEFTATPVTKMSDLPRASPPTVLNAEPLLPKPTVISQSPEAIPSVPVTTSEDGIFKDVGEIEHEGENKLDSNLVNLDDKTTVENYVEKEAEQTKESMLPIEKEEYRQQKEDHTKQAEKPKVGREKVNKQKEDHTKQAVKPKVQQEEANKQKEDHTKQAEKPKVQQEEVNKQKEVHTKQAEKSKVKQEEANKQKEDHTKQAEKPKVKQEEVNKQKKDHTKQAEKLEVKQGEVNKQEKVTKQEEDHTKQAENPEVKQVDVTKQKEDHAKQAEKPEVKVEEVTEQKEDHNKQAEKSKVKQEEVTKQKEDHAKQAGKPQVKVEEVTKQKEDHTRQAEKPKVKQEEVNKQKEDHAKQAEKPQVKLEEVTKQKEDHTKQAEKPKVKQEDVVKQEEVTKENEGHTKQAEKPNDKQQDATKQDADHTKQAQKPQVEEKKATRQEHGNIQQTENSNVETDQVTKRKETSDQPVEKLKEEKAEDRMHELNKQEEESTIKAVNQKKKLYPKHDITNEDDYKIQSKLDDADTLLQQNKAGDALKIYDNLLKSHPRSPRAVFGKAQALNVKAEIERSNVILEQAIDEYMKMFDLPNVPDALLLKSGRECSERQSFRGWSGKAVKTLRKLLALFPNDMLLWNELGVKYLITSNGESARQVFEHVLKNDPEDGFALVHMGFIISQTDGDYLGSIPYLQKGIASGAEGTRENRFYMRLGDAYLRTEQEEKARKTYAEGARQGVFLSEWQRSSYNVDRLTGRPWWTAEQTKNEKFLKILEENWLTIRDEGMAQMNESTGMFLPEEENLTEEGDWKQLTLYSRGRKHKDNCAKTPKTCAILDQFSDAVGCKRGQVKYSVMHPGVHVWPHVGPTNCRIRAHLGLVVPEGVRIRVASDTKTWKEGKFILFDDSFEHEVWHEGNSLRLVLIVDVWHPELTAREKSTLSAI